MKKQSEGSDCFFSFWNARIYGVLPAIFLVNWVTSAIFAV